METTPSERNGKIFLNEIIQGNFNLRPNGNISWDLRKTDLPFHNDF
jgi:hypothetical protein